MKNYVKSSGYMSKKTMSKISIIIPAHNEADNLHHLMHELIPVLVQYDETRDFEIVIVNLYRKEMLDEIGLFDKSYFAYFEDVDLSFRMHLFGWKCIYVPDAVIYHMHSATARTASPFKIFFIERNKLWNMWKYFPLPILALQLPYTNIHYLKYLSKFLNKMILRKESNVKEEPILNYSFLSIVFAVVRAKFSAYGRLPYIFIWRRRLRSKGVDLKVLERWIRKRKVA